jgi:hypothetical protein
VLTPGGDVIKESIGAFPRVILAEGEYRAIARNEGKVFEREFKVVTGVDGDVEVLGALRTGRPTELSYTERNYSCADNC